LGDCLLRSVFNKVAHILGYILFPTIIFMEEFWQKMCWTTFWAIFSQTHLVTVPPSTAKRSEINLFACVCFFAIVIVNCCSACASTNNNTHFLSL
jgi:hypothetical protein